MARVRINLDTLEFIRERGVLDSKTNQKLGNFIIGKSKEFISKGISPVKGGRRFVRYSKDYPTDSQKSKFNKKRRPVNMSLSGKMLRDFRILSTKLNKLTIGIKDSRSAEIFGFHNQGEENNPQRKMLPTGQNEEFNVTINNGILNVISKRIAEIIKKTRKITRRAA